MQLYRVDPATWSGNLPPPPLMHQPGTTIGRIIGQVTDFPADKGDQGVNHVIRGKSAGPPAQRE